MSEWVQLPLDIEPIKRCHTCDQWKSLERFVKDSRYRGGYNHRCKDCHRSYVLSRKTGAPQLHKVHDPARALFADGLHRCAKCRQVKHLSLFNHCASNPFGVIARCRDCQHHDSKIRRPLEQKRQQRRYPIIYLYVRERVRQWRLANPERATLNVRKHVHKRRSLLRVRGPLWTAHDIMAMREKQNNQCAYCGILIPPYHIEHRTPLSRGGTNDPSNLCLSCPDCNLHKGKKTDTEFRALRCS